jgi:hypothetical protein
MGAVRKQSYIAATSLAGAWPETVNELDESTKGNA